MNIYLASSWKNTARVLMWAKELRQEGHKVDAFCDTTQGRVIFSLSELEEAKDLNVITALKFDKVISVYREDRHWIDWADCAILLLPSGKSAHIEAGYAKGCGKKLVIYQRELVKGEFEVMYGFADLVTDSVKKVFDFLKD